MDINAEAKPVTTAKAKGPAKASGVIVYNKYLDAWRCVDADGVQVLCTGSKEAAVKEFPNFTVKE